MLGLFRFLNRALPSERKDAVFSLMPDQMYSPGYWVSYTALARKEGLSVDQLDIPTNLFYYARALQIEQALGEVDSYPYERRNRGQNYSPLVVLDSRDSVDPATTCMGGCVRNLFPWPELEGFAAELCDLIGDLHDNVWSHGLSTGISMAQRWRKTGSQKEYEFEFALADCGIGFLRELQRAGVAQREAIGTDAEAITWCIRKGNTSKPSPRDEWAQRLPEDMMRNPIPGVVVHGDDWNHHLGLGLAKLVTLVTNYGGVLWLATGGTMLTIRQDGSHTLRENAINWDGVALACRFSTDRARERAGRHQEADSTDALLEQIVRGDL